MSAGDCVLVSASISRMRALAQARTTCIASGVSFGSSNHDHVGASGAEASAPSPTTTSHSLAGTLASPEFPPLFPRASSFHSVSGPLSAVGYKSSSQTATQTFLSWNQIGISLRRLEPHSVALPQHLNDAIVRRAKGADTVRARHRLCREHHVDHGFLGRVSRRLKDRIDLSEQLPYLRRELNRR